MLLTKKLKVLWNYTLRFHCLAGKGNRVRCGIKTGRVSKVQWWNSQTPTQPWKKPLCRTEPDQSRGHVFLSRAVISLVSPFNQSHWLRDLAMMLPSRYHAMTHHRFILVCMSPCVWIYYSDTSFQLWRTNYGGWCNIADVRFIDSRDHWQERRALKYSTTERRCSVSKSCFVGRATTRGSFSW